MERRMILFNFQGTRSGTSIASRHTSAQLQPKIAKTDIHKSLSFSAESDRIQTGRRASSVSIESGGIFGID
jgi:hypothetical protein